MRIDAVSAELQAQIVEMINNAEDKGQAIAEAIEQIVSAGNQSVVDRILQMREEARGNEERMRELGIRTSFSANEKAFYERLKMGAKQAITADQIDIIPNEVIDRTLTDVRTQYPIIRLINFAPADVKRWLTASKTGAAAWGGLTDAITQELSATIESLPIEVSKLSVFCTIPKAIRDLEIGYVEKYFRSIMSEAMYDGVVAGYLDGDGKTAPIGILRKIDESETDGTKKAKTVNNTFTGFSPKKMAPVTNYLSKNGKRSVAELVLIANPEDASEYVYPALYGDSIANGYVNKSFRPIEVIEEPQMPKNKAAITMPGYYVMGFSGMKVDEYKETKALEDADLLIAKVYGNGRPEDDNTAYVFNPSKLEEYISTVKTVSEP